MTAVDRPDNGQDEQWVDEGCSCGNPSPRTYEHDPSCTLVRCRRCGMDLPDHLPGDDLCRPCTRPHLTSARAGAGEQQRVTRDQIAATLREHIWVRVSDLFRCKCGFVPEDSPSIEDHRADKLLALLDRTQPDDDPGPQCPSTSHDTDGGWRCEHRAGHDGGHRNREVEW